VKRASKPNIDIKIVTNTNHRKNPTIKLFTNETFKPNITEKISKD